MFQKYYSKNTWSTLPLLYNYCFLEITQNVSVRIFSFRISIVFVCINYLYHLAIRFVIKTYCVTSIYGTDFTIYRLSDPWNWTTHKETWFLKVQHPMLTILVHPKPSFCVLLIIEKLKLQLSLSTDSWWKLLNSSTKWSDWRNIFFNNLWPAQLKSCHFDTFLQIPM